MTGGRRCVGRDGDATQRMRNRRSVRATMQKSFYHEAMLVPAISTMKVGRISARQLRRSRSKVRAQTFSTTAELKRDKRDRIGSGSSSSSSNSSRQHAVVTKEEGMYLRRTDGFKCTREILKVFIGNASPSL